MTRKRHPNDDEGLAIRQELEDLEKALPYSDMTREGPCPICGSRVRHLCSRCESELDGTVALRMLRIRERIQTLLVQFIETPRAFIDAVFSESLVDDVVMAISYLVFVSERENKPRLSLCEALSCKADPLMANNEEAFQRQQTLLWQFLLTVLAQQPPLKEPCPVNSWSRFGLISIFVGVTGGPRIELDCNWKESVSASARELACRNLLFPAPSPELAADEYRNRLNDPQDGVRGWAAVRLAELDPSTPNLRDHLNSMLSWPSKPLLSEDDWQKLDSQGIVEDPYTWSYYAEKAIKRLS